MPQTYAKFEDIESEILKRLRSAERSVRVCVAWISHKIYGETLVALRQRGVLIEVLCNDDHKNLGFIEFSHSYGINVRPISANISSALMHNKFCILDERIVVTGSYNWSENAARSFENIVVSVDDFLIVKQYLHEFYELVDFYNGHDIGFRNRCEICKSLSFNLGVFGPSWGIYNESKIELWSFCIKNYHVRNYGGSYEQFLLAHLGLDSESENDDFVIDSPEVLFRSFQIERLQSQRVEQHFVELYSVRIDAVGFVRCISSTFDLKYGMPSSYEIFMVWRRPSARKRIPKSLDESSGGISQIIDPYRYV